MKLLILGGTGNMSRQITLQAVQAGHDVTVFNRGTRKDFAVPSEVRVVTGDRRTPGLLEEKFHNCSFDAVIDMLSYTEDDALQTLKVFDGHVQHIIFTSSTAAYEMPQRTVPVREDSCALWTENIFPYGFEKAKMERRVWSTVSEAAKTIIRPSLTFGVGCSNIGILRQNANIMYRILEGRSLVMMGDGTMYRNFTFAPDMADAYLKTLLNPAAYGKAFNVTNGISYMWDDLYNTVASVLGCKADLVHISTETLLCFDPVLFGHLELEKKYCGLFDCSAFRQAVPDWKPRYDLKKGMEMIVSWWQESRFPLNEEKDIKETLICEKMRAFRKTASFGLSGSADYVPGLL